MKTIKKIGIYERRDGHDWLVDWLTRDNWLRMAWRVLSLRAFPRVMRFSDECARYFD